MADSAPTAAIVAICMSPPTVGFMVRTIGAAIAVAASTACRTEPKTLRKLRAIYGAGIGGGGGSGTPFDAPSLAIASRTGT